MSMMKSPAPLDPAPADAAPANAPPLRGAAREAAILAIAGEVFLADGYAGASMADICGRVGGSKATLYKRFPSKQALFIAVVQQRTNLLYAELRQVPGPWPDLRTGLTQFGRRLLGVVMSRPYLALQRLIIAEADRFPMLTDTAYHARRDTIVGPLGERMRGEMEAGRIVRADPIEAAETFWTLCIAVVFRRMLTTAGAAIGAEEADYIVAHGVSVFLAAYGLGPWRGSVAAPADALRPGDMPHSGGPSALPDG